MCIRDSFKDALEGGGANLPPFIKDLVDGTAALGPMGLAISGVVAALTASFAVLGAVGLGIFKLGEFAIGAQESLEGVSQEAINVAKRSPIARTEIAKLSDELEKTGLHGAALEAALEKLIEKKYGKEATKSMMGLSVQIAKAKENAALLFTGVKTGPLLEAVSKLLAFFDASTVEGQALKQLIETLLNPIIDGIGKAGPAAKRFFQGMLIGALEVAIGILLLKKRFQELTGINLGPLSKIDWTKIGAVSY